MSTSTTKKPWHDWKECAPLCGDRANPNGSPISVSEAFDFKPTPHSRPQPPRPTPCTDGVVRPVDERGQIVGEHPRDVKPLPKEVKPVKLRTNAFFERLATVETSLKKLNVDLAAGTLAKGFATEAALRTEIDGLKTELTKVKNAKPVKVAPEPPKLPVEGDQVWLKSSGKGPFLLVSKTHFDMEVEREVVAATKDQKGMVASKSRFGVEGFVARRIGDGKPVVLPLYDCTLTKPTFPTFVGRAVKYGFVALGLTTLLTATLAFGRMAIDRAAHGPDVAPVKTSSQH